MGQPSSTNREADMTDFDNMTDDEYDDWRFDRFAERLLSEGPVDEKDDEAYLDGEALG